MHKSSHESTCKTYKKSRSGRITQEVELLSWLVIRILDYNTNIHGIR